MVKNTPALIFNNLIFQIYLPAFRYNGVIDTDEILTNEKKRIFFNAVLTRRPKKINKAIWITHNWTDAYYHWFIDALPRMLMAEEYANVNNPIILPDYYKDITFVQQSLAILKKNVVYYESGIPYWIKQLTITKHAAPIGSANPKLINQLSNILSLKTNKNPNRFIFVSRKKAKKRFIINEQELNVLFASLGIEVHCFEDYTLNQQIQLMAECKLLIGLHGAGLTNMLFMPEKAVIVELRNDEKAPYNHCYKQLANALGHSYFEYIADTTITENEYNIRVNVRELEIKLNKIINGNCN